MEVLKEKIKKFLEVRSSNGSGYGDGYGSGYGYSSGFGYGNGSGYGDGYGSGYGYSYGFGYGNGSSNGSSYGDDVKDIKVVNEEKVYIVDGVPTLIYQVFGDFAKGAILSNDLTLKPCYIAKKGNFYAHGETLRQAFADATTKELQDKPLGERIAEFNHLFPDRDRKVPAEELYKWHSILTGSCEMGRRTFCDGHGIDYKNGMYSVNEFIALTKGAYGGDIIRKLEMTTSKVIQNYDKSVKQ